MLLPSVTLPLCECFSSPIFYTYTNKFLFDSICFPFFVLCHVFFFFANIIRAMLMYMCIMHMDMYDCCSYATFDFGTNRTKKKKDRRKVPDLSNTSTNYAKIYSGVCNHWPSQKKNTKHLDNKDMKKQQKKTRKKLQQSTACFYRGTP